MVVKPAVENRGIWFKRTDITDGDPLVHAIWNGVNPSPLCTRVSNDHGTEVATVEHIMAALAGCGITNALIEIDGPEVPIVDGSAAPFVRGLLDCGVAEQSQAGLAIKVLRSVVARNGESWARLDPGASLSIDFNIEFDEAAIGQQSKSLNMANGSFVRELCDSRTFCRNSDVEAMYAQGLALGGSLENAVVVEGDQILSPGGLRHSDEAVRHKMLDALGDLALAGAPLLGRYTGHKAGHSLTNALLRALFADADNFEMVECDPDINAALPGAGVHINEIPAIT